MFPYADDTPSYSIPIWIILLIILNVFFYFESVSDGDRSYLQTIFNYGTIPARFYQTPGKPLQFSSELRSAFEEAKFEIDESKMAAPLITLFTAIFLHGGIAHLLGNMWFLWIFGDNVEDRLGKLIFPIFYIVSGLCAGILHVILLRNSVVPAIGASGAIAGVMGAYIYMFPRSTVATLVTFGYFWRIVHIPGVIYLGLWFVLQFFGGLTGGETSNVAFWAHVGGFIAGLLLAMLFSAMRLVNWADGDRGDQYLNYSSYRRRYG